MASFSGRNCFFYTLTNVFLTTVGAIALHVVSGLREKAESESQSICNPQFDWQRAIRSGVTLGMGLLTLVVGTTRQVSMERLLLKEWFHHNSNSSSPLLVFAGSMMVIGTLVAMSDGDDDISDHDCDENREEDNDGGDDDDDDNDDDDVNGLYSTVFVLRPTEDNSIGAEPVKHGISKENEEKMIQNDIMATNRDFLDCTIGLGTPDGTILVEEETNNTVADSGNDDDHSSEQEFVDLAECLDESNSPQ